MSENSHDYQTTNEVPKEQVNTQDVSNAMEERLIEQSKSQQQNSDDIEAESAQRTETDAPNDEFASKFAALSRKEKDIRGREQELEKRLSQFEEKFAKYDAQLQPQESTEPEVMAPAIADLIKNDPVAALEQAGWSYEDITNMILNDGKMPTDRQLQLRIEEVENGYKSRVEELENKLLDQEKQKEEASYNQVIEDYKNDIKGFIDQDTEAYELVQANDAYDLVFDVIEQHHQETGRVLDTKTAVDQVESYLEGELKKVYQKSKKMSSWKRDEAEEAPQAIQRHAPTLSNSLSAQGEPARAERSLSREESLARAAAAIKWED
jgi:hypothetical protein